jgi:N-acetylmuramoyl-L-alanine amidase
MLLKNGSKGEDVKKLQVKLGVEAIGTFGPKTEAAVKSWQKSNVLTDIGIVEIEMWNKLFGNSVITEDKVITPTVN